MLSTPIGLNSLGAVFNIEAPFSACRLCGAVFQSKEDRLSKQLLISGKIVEHWDPNTRTSTFSGDLHDLAVIDVSQDKRDRWRVWHERRYHTDSEIALLHSTGFAFTPEAANKLAPYGITPMGNMHEEIVDALHKAPRAPVTDAEGG